MPGKLDFYRNSETLLIEVSFSVSDEYLKTLYSDAKVGFTKIPSAIGEFNQVKNGTEWAESSFNDYKTFRSDISVTEKCDDISTIDKFEKLWMKAIKAKFLLEDNQVVICLKVNRDECKPHYYVGDLETKDIVSIFPSIAFIDDDRNFVEEESGKSKTLTANIFNNILVNRIYNQTELACKNCLVRDCKAMCINYIYDKKIEELSINELEKLVNYKTEQSSESITKSLTVQFQKNYRPDYKISIQATSSIDKSFTLATKIYDPILETEIELSNVGAGLRSIYILSLLQSYQEMMGRYCIFLVEEPELYLHPELQKSMAKTLWGISEVNQVFFTTHSPIMLKEFSLEDVRSVKLDSENYETIVENANLQVILNELGYSSQDIMHTDFVLFVEGKDDLLGLKAIILNYYNVDFNKVLVIDTKSCQNIETYATLRFLNRTTMRTDFAIFRDADTMDREKVKEKVINQMKENVEPDYLNIVRKHIYVTEYSSIEGYFINLDILLKHHVFATSEKMKNAISHALVTYKIEHVNYFSDKNKKQPDRIADFLSEYDIKIQEPFDNIEWLKQNIRGHNLFGYLNASKIPLSNFVQEIPQSAFQGIIDFLDTHKYFKDRKK